MPSKLSSKGFVHRIFETTAEKYPHKSALIFEDEQLTYQELNYKANQLANFLKSRYKNLFNKNQDKLLIAVCIEPGIDLIVTILAILKCGITYLPIDPESPQERLKHMLRKTKAKIIITQKNLQEKYSKIIKTQQICCIDQTLLQQLSNYDHKNLKDITTNRLAYILFTSGTTGTPKAVCISHYSVANLVLNQKYIKFSKNDYVAQIANINFDAAVFEIFGALLNGCTLVLFSRNSILNAHVFSEKIQANQISIMLITTGLFNHFFSILPSLFDFLTYLLIGGENLNYSDIKSLFKRKNKPQHIINVYGVTEGTVISTYYSIQKFENKKNVPIGKEINNVECFVLDNQLNQVPNGGIGELYISGDGLAQSYLNDETATKNKFLKYKKSRNKYLRLYKTGDIVKLLSSGNLEFISRKDDQIKIEGARVDPNEIKKYLLKHSGIKQCVVLTKNGAKGENKLLAFIISKDAKDISSENLRVYLSKYLPGYAIPRQYFFIDSMPLTPNGKVNNSILLGLENIKRPLLVEKSENIDNKTQKTLKKIWCDSFNLKNISIYDNYFELGGDSFICINIISEAYQQGLSTTISEIFKFPTIFSLSRHLNSKGNLPFKPYEMEMPKTVEILNGKQNRIIPNGAQRFIVNDNIKTIFGLSPLQEGLLFHKNFAPNSDIYIVQIMMTVNGNVNDALFKEVVQKIFQHTDVLRTGFSSEQESFQFILNQLALDYKFINLEGVNETNKQQLIEEFLLTDRLKNFSLENPPLIRFNLLRLEKEKFIFIISYHHILLDGWSINQILKEIVNGYLFVKNKKPFSPTKFSSYETYINHVKTKILNNQENDEVYWKDLLKNYVNTKIFDSQLNSTDMAPYLLSEYGSSSVTLPSKLVENLRFFCKKNKITLNTLFQAVWGLLLAYYSGKNDVVFGITLFPVHDDYFALHNTLGLFINTLPARIKIEPSKNILDYMQQVQNQTIETIQHGNYSIAQIKKWCGILGRQDLFENIFILENYPLPNFNQNQKDFFVEEIEFFEKIHYSLITKVIIKEAITISLDYQKNKFADEFVKQMLMHYYSIIMEAIKENRPIREISILTNHEKSILKQWNGTSQLKFLKKTFCQLFNETLQHHPLAIAVNFNGEKLTYKQLAEKSDAFAKHLLDNTIAHGMVVAVCVDRSINTLIIMLAIWKIGAVYLPLDPTYPRKRIDYIFSDAQPAAIVCLHKYYDRFTFYKIKKIVIDKLMLSNINAVLSVLCPSINDLMYIIYTSGSTGNPKGVLIKHKGVSNVLLSISNKIDLKPLDKFFAVTSTTFDISILELLMPLIVGAEVVIASQELTRDGLSLANYLDASDISFMQATPTTWKMLLYSGWQNKSNLRILCGGEVLSKDISMDFLKLTNHFWNFYGPTETTIWSTAEKISTVNSELISIGHPLENTECYVLNEYLQEMPINTIGELYIGGIGLAQGYLNNEEQTDAVFIDNPFSIAKEKNKLYKTGDFVRRLIDGRLEFICRIDRQLKLRGFRVELLEIENYLKTYPNVEDAIVEVTCEENKDLMAFILPKTKFCLKAKLQWSLFYFSENNAVNNSYQFYLDSAQFADKNNFMAVWTPERHFHEVGGQYPNPAILSAALATITKQVQLRAGSVVLPLQNPIRVAEEWSVIDNLSNGRVGVAFASGWGIRDFVLAPENYKNRQTVLFDYITIVNKLWRNEAIPFKNGVGEIDEIKIYPKPVQKQLPIWITTAGNPETFREAGKIGARILTHLVGQTVDELTGKIKIYQDALKQFGHGIDKSHVTLMIHTFIDEDKNRAIELSRKPFCEYLKAHLSLLKQSTNGKEDILSKKDSIESDCYLNDIFDKYVESAALIGSPGSCINLVKLLYKIGINEIACLIDFGINEKLVLNNLKYINDIKNQSNDLAGAELEEINTQDLFSYIKRNLPAYMTPSSIVTINELPVTLSGKIDHQALKKLYFKKQNVGTKRYVPAATLEEKKIIDIIENVLQIKHIGITDNFFELGGHSLLATRVLSQIKNEYHVVINFQLFFLLPTVENLARLIVQQKTENNILVLKKVKRVMYMPLSFSQQRMWFLHKMEPNSHRYHDAFAFELLGPLDFNVLEKSFQVIIKRHEILRTVFAEIDSDVYQVIKPEINFSLSFIKADDFDMENNSLDEKLLTLSIAPFDLSVGPLIKAYLLSFSNKKNILLIILHHIITDGWSLSILIKELSVFYKNQKNDNNVILPEIFIQYADFAFCQREWTRDKTLDKYLNYWRKTLEGELPMLNLPTDYKRPVIESYQGGITQLSLEKELIDKIKRLATKQNSTLYAILFAAFNILLFKYTGESEAIVGTPIANRNDIETEKLIGLFVNTLAIKSKFTENTTINDFLTQTTKNLIEGYSYQDLPFDKLVKEIQPERDLSYNPIFQVLFVLQNVPINKLQLSDITTKHYNFPLNISRFDLSLEVVEGEGEINAVFKYKTELFFPETILRLANHYKNILNSILDGQDKKISEIDYLSREELKNVLVNWNVGKFHHIKDETILQQFYNFAKKSPFKTAVIHNEQRITYKELNDLSSKIANKMQDIGIKKQDYIGLLLNRSTDFIISILAILKCGAIYVPIDIEQSREQIENVLLDTQAQYIITNNKFFDKLSTTNVKVINFDMVSTSRVTENSFSFDNISTGNDVVCLMYTSGTTGNPKGIKITNRGICCLASQKGLLEIKESDRVAHAASINFDASTFEIWCPLLKGATVVIIDQPILLTPDLLEKSLKDYQVTVLWLTSALFNRFIALNTFMFNVLDKLIVGGEALDVKSIREAKLKHPHKPKIINGYGPTENTTFSTCYDILDVDENQISIPIGKPIDNTFCYILDKILKPVSVGIYGELYIGGDGLSSGYLNQDMLTRTYFISNPFSNSNEKLYKTGDWCRWLPDGNIEYIGRVDTQIKLRGYRIELSAIENKLRQYPGVTQAFVQVHNKNPDSKKLIAYLEMTDQPSVEKKSIEEHLENWKVLYQKLYKNISKTKFSAFNTIGWNSSYTNQAFTSEEMNEWLSDILGVIASTNYKNVFEIGCGTGMLLSKIAPQCEKYYGTDFSPEVLSYVNKFIEKNNLQHVVVEPRIANDFSGVPINEYDTIILNSVVQYFPNIDYLLDVLKKAVAVLKNDGKIIIGDIRNADLAYEFYCSISLQKELNVDDIAQLDGFIKKSLKQEYELLVSPKFFMVGESLVLIIACFGAFSGSITTQNIFKMIFSAYLLKIIYAVILSWPAQMVTTFLKLKCDIDIYDNETNFNPFNFP